MSRTLWGGVNLSNRSILFNPTVPHAASSRAVETTIDNLDAFKVTAFLPGADNYMENVAYTKADGAWSTNDGNFFWPTSSEYLNFYAYAPAEPCKMATSEDADGASFSIDHQFQKLENFSPKAAAAEQKDFIYAYAKGNLEDNGTDGVDIKFKHALSQITIAAKNDNKAYTVKVSGVKIGNVMSKSTFSFPSTGGDGNDASWSQDSQTGSYTTEWESDAVELSSDVKDFKDQGNVPFMLIPQSLTSTSKAYDGAYIALKVSIAMQGGKVLCTDKWAYVGIGDSWEMGKRYNYTLDFSNGAGQDAEGNLIISGKGIKLSVNMGDWTAEDMTEKVICGTATREFTYNVGEMKNMVTPDASGNWSIPVAKFKGITSTTQMFNSCESLTSMDVSSWNTNKVTRMDHMFNGCKNLASFDLRHFATSNVTDMSGMFISCKSLTTLDLSGWNTSKVTNMAAMFNGCESLTTLDLSGWNTSKVTDMTTMFYWCKSLTFLDLSHFNTSNVTSMNYMFCECNSLTSLDLSDWNTSNVTSMDNMIDRCTALTSLDLSGWNTSKVTSMNNMFSYCRSLTSLDLSHFNTSNVTSMNYMFYECNSLTSLDLSGWNTNKVTNMNYMFGRCTALTSLDLSGWDTSNVTNIGTLLYDCTSLTTLDLSGWEISNVTYIGGMFNWCKSLTTIRMKGCNEATINKIKSELANDGITGCTIVTE